MVVDHKTWYFEIDAFSSSLLSVGISITINNACFAVGVVEIEIFYRTKQKCDFLRKPLSLLPSNVQWKIFKIMQQFPELSAEVILQSVDIKVKISSIPFI